MKYVKFFTGLVFGCLLTLIVIIAISPLSPQPAMAQTKVRWEYCFSTANAGNAGLNQLGNAGWEAYAISSNGQVAFKRRK